MLQQLIRKLGKDESGIAYVEFALSLPFLMILFLGTVEVSRYLLLNQKLEKVSNTIGDVVAQASEARTSEFDELLSVTQNIMLPFRFDTNATVIISSIRRNDGITTVQWQYSGGGQLNRESELGEPGDVATLPPDFAMFDGENTIVAEVHYDFEPLLNQDILGEQPLYKMAMFRPRLGALTTLTDDN